MCQDFYLTFPGKIELYQNGQPDEYGGETAKGNVYFEGDPVCDRSWSKAAAEVVCR